MNTLRLIQFNAKLLSSRIPVSCCASAGIQFGPNPEASNFNRPQKRNLSLKNSMDSMLQTQSEFFKSLSESAPVEKLQNFLVYSHDSLGLPWWATIMCTTVLLRTTITVPLAIYQQYILAKLELIKLVEMPEIVKELKKETNFAVKLFNWDEKTARATYNRSVRKQYNNLIVRDNCHPLKSAILLLFQIPLWISFSISLRNLVYMLPYDDVMAKLHYSQLTVEGFSWITNLTQVDSTYVLPLTFGLLNLAIIELQYLSKVTVPTKAQKYITNFFRGLCIITIPISASVPSCLVLYWTTSSAFGIIQNIVLMSPRVKRLFRIPQTPSELDRPYKQVLTGIKHKLRLDSDVNKS